MLESYLPKKKDRTYFNSLTSHASVVDYLSEEMGLDLTATGKEKVTGESRGLSEDISKLILPPDQV